LDDGDRGQQWSQESALQRDLMLTCMRNLLLSTEERVFFKDRVSRFLLVSAGWLEAIAPGRTVEEVIGKTDYDFFGAEHAAAASEDERRIVRSGRPMAAKLERETFPDRAGVWVSTTKMPLVDEKGEIIGTFGISRDVTAQVNAEDALAYQALHDPVTGLANRVLFMDRLSQALAALDRRHGRLAVLFVDLDGFKQVNDSFGHDAGDQVLCETGRRLSLLVRRADTVARLGGDEFVVLCSWLSDDDDIDLIGQRIVRAVRAPYLRSGDDLSVTCSVGIACTRFAAVEPETLVREADRAMYEAKKGGGSFYKCHDVTGTT
jgi:diguanylate cyclase (GGDEF)-like protein/PAS domain S-box-containing protein